MFCLFFRDFGDILRKWKVRRIPLTTSETTQKKMFLNILIELFNIVVNDFGAKKVARFNLVRGKRDPVSARCCWIRCKWDTL